jgi:hypothetical protein
LTNIPAVSPGFFPRGTAAACPKPGLAGGFFQIVNLLHISKLTHPGISGLIRGKAQFLCDVLGPSKTAGRK